MRSIQSKVNKMKYHEKLNLKSPIFKYNNTTTSRTPSKSPIKPPINPTDLFQKVCCPSCKFGFKIIRQQVMKENPPDKVATPTKKGKVCLYKDFETQTQGILTQSNNNSPTKSIVSQHKFSKTYDFSGVNMSKDQQMSRFQEVLQQQQNIQNRQLKESEFKFKPLSLSPHSKFSKSKNLLKTLDSKPLQVQIQQSPGLGKSPGKSSAEYLNPYYVHRDRKEENLYHQHGQTLPFRDQEDFYNGLENREYGNGGNIEREPAGYGNSNARGGEGGLVSPHASSEKLEESNLKNGPVDRSLMDTPKNTNYGKGPKQVNPSKTPHSNQMRMQEPSPRANRGNQNQNFPNQHHSPKYQNQPSPPPQMIPSKKDSPEFEELITQIVLKNQEQEQVIKELQEICKVVSEEVELPSFCKMLAYVE